MCGLGGRAVATTQHGQSNDPVHDTPNNITYLDEVQIGRLSVCMVGVPSDAGD